MAFTSLILSSSTVPVTIRMVKRAGTLAFHAAETKHLPQEGCIAR